MEEEQIASSSSFIVTATSTSAICLDGGCAGGRAIDRFNPIIRDPSRIGKPQQPTPDRCCHSYPIPAINPKSRPQSKSSQENENHHHDDIDKGKSTSGGNSNTIRTLIKKEKKKSSSNWTMGCSKIGGGETVSPPGSSRYLLLSNNLITTSTSDDDHQKSLLSSEEHHHHHQVGMQKVSSLLQQPPSSTSLSVNVVDESTSSSSSANSIPTSSPSSSSSSSYSASSEQVVLLRVSLHCKGCERKMRKHISKMEGVRSFDIDFAAKQLTVVGDVTPLSVLASVSKVKNAQLLTPPPLSSSTPSACTNIFENKEDKFVV